MSDPQEACPVRVALVGLGGWGRAIADATRRVPSLELVAGYDPLPAACADFAARFGVATTSDRDALFAHDFDAVLVVTPNTTHAEWTRFASQRRKHVYVEKPIAATVAEARQMQADCDVAGVTLFVGHNTRRYGGHRRLKQLVESGALGTIVMAEAHTSHAGGMGLTGTEWRAHREECPAVGLMQLGVHHADTLQYLLGPVTEVTALFAHVAAPVPIDDATLSLLRFASGPFGGPLGYLGSNYATPYHFRIALFGTAANAFCENGGNVTIFPAGNAPQTEEIVQGDTLVEELAEFANCIRTGAKPETDSGAGIRALAVVEAAIRSAEERHTISL